ncbi:MAG: NAD(P)H-dependent oxidoreductase [Microcystis aeruginosa L111-01]|jgi:ABC-type phosphate/phosphonate transport system substrate-binding protein|nr:NAD(P)H-dependent oxidoreductase [Microcystis aeruginosa L111-01]NCR60309.1 NAD(P)H-dependent oxidoreductase [Microcystis aeruginosa LL13-06]NCS01703.1 NAD(P)H-dependent oxidoreductase [Microcystis aeruginosa G13-11]
MRLQTVFIQLRDMKSMITIPITLEQLISVIQQLQPSERTKIAKALIEVELQSDLKALIKELYNQDPVDEVTDNDIMQEIQAVRQAKIK